MDTAVHARTALADDLVARAQQGEADAFTALVEEHHQHLVRVAFVICGDLEVAFDAVQAAWIRAWHHLPALREPERVEAWLVAIAANEARQASRARRRRTLREVPMPVIEPSHQTSPEDHLDIQDALARLDPDDRRLLALRYVAGFDAAEIGRATGRTAGGVRTRLFRLMARLRTDLTHD